MKKVSVIVPIYNVEKYLDKCLSSLVNQTLDDIEILAINDGSPDKSQDIVDRYVQQYPDKVKSFIKTNGGIASVRNFGIEHATGEYIGYLDGDDYAELNMFEILYETAKKENSDIVVCDFYFTYDDHEKIHHEESYNSSKEMMVKLHAVVWNKIYRTEFVKKVGIRFIEGCRYEDASYMYKLSPHIKQFVFVKEPLIHYVQHSGSYMSTHNHKVKDVIYVFEDLYEYFKINGLYDDYREELEYLSIKFFLGQPFRSAVKIKARKDRLEILDMLYGTLNNHFPDWKKNQYLTTLPGLKHKYFKSVNKFTYKLYSLLFRYIKYEL